MHSDFRVLAFVVVIFCYLGMGTGLVVCFNGVGGAFCFCTSGETKKAKRSTF